MVPVLDRLKAWLLWVIVFGVFLDLAISTVLIFGTLHAEHTTNRLNHITHAAQCWDRVLSEAVTGKTPHDILMSQAEDCAKLIP